MKHDPEAIAKKLFRLVILPIIVAVTDRVFGPNVQSADIRCAELDKGKDLPIPGGCGKRRIAVQARPGGNVFAGLFLTQEGLTPIGIEDARQWREALLEEVQAFDEREGLNGWATGHFRAFVARKDDDHSPPEILIAPHD